MRIKEPPTQDSSAGDAEVSRYEGFSHAIREALHRQPDSWNSASGSACTNVASAIATRVVPRHLARSGQRSVTKCSKACSNKLFRTGWTLHMMGLSCLSQTEVQQHFLDIQTGRYYSLRFEIENQFQGAWYMWLKILSPSVSAVVGKIVERSWLPHYPKGIESFNVARTSKVISKTWRSVGAVHRRIGG